MDQSKIALGIIDVFQLFLQTKSSKMVVRQARLVSGDFQKVQNHQTKSSKMAVRQARLVLGDFQKVGPESSN